MVVHDIYDIVQMTNTSNTYVAFPFKNILSLILKNSF